MTIRQLFTLAPLLLAAPAFQEAAPNSAETGGLEVDHFIFFAVLEGLFDDGVPQGYAEKVLERGDAPGGYANFVYACPICRPTIEAFKAYALREQFTYARKGEIVGRDLLPLDIGQRILAGAADARRAGLHKLVERYLQRRMALLRLTEEERKQWKALLQARREVGMQSLKGWKLPWKECPSCEGVCDGAKK